MSHQSENAMPLSFVLLGETNLQNTQMEDSCVYLVHLPDNVDPKGVCEEFYDFSTRLDEHSVLCIFADPYAAAYLFNCINEQLKLQHWIAVKSPICVTLNKLATQHRSLLILTKSKGTLQHNKTRIAYSYCPAVGPGSCNDNKTTKDYGGKKHTFDAYGTLMSDVWRDLEATSTNLSSVVDRLRDLFGCPPYQGLRCIDLSSRSLPRRHLPGVVAYDEQTTIREDLLNGDCIQVLQEQVPDDSIDFCFVDPPYNIQKKYDKWDDGLEMEEYFHWCDRWLDELYRVLKPGRTLAVLNIPEWCARHFAHINNKMAYQNWIAWDGLGQPMRKIMPAHYGILCMSKGEPRPLPTPDEADSVFSRPIKEWHCIRGSCVSARAKNRYDDRCPLPTDLWWDVHRLRHNSRRADHPCQLPPLLMKRLYAIFTRRGETILDCFNGVGTSTLSAAQMGRGYIGIELSPEYHAIALDRHQQVKEGKDPFNKTSIIPTAKNSQVKRLEIKKYEVPKKVLQLEVKGIGNMLGREPTREDVERYTKYDIDMFLNYFHNWSEVTAAYRSTGMKETRQ